MLATPDKLLDVLNDPTMDLDMLFLDRILLTFRSFSTTEILLNDLISRYLCRVPDNATEEEMDFFDQKQLKQQQRFCIFNLEHSIFLNGGLSIIGRILKPRTGYAKD